jgi:hypothetical protein
MRRPEGLIQQGKNRKMPSEIETATYRLVAQCLNYGVTYVIPLPVFKVVPQNSVTHVTTFVRFALRKIVFILRLTLGSTQPPIQRVRGFFPGSEEAGA